MPSGAHKWASKSRSRENEREQRRNPPGNRRERKGRRERIEIKLCELSGLCGKKVRERMNRRDFLKKCGAVGAGGPATLGRIIPAFGGFVLSNRALEAQTGAKRPNIILIMADDLGYECLGCYGSKSYKTPVLDRLAGAGMRFEHCYSQPLCTPSRVKIMTGQYNFRNYTAFGVLNPMQKTFGHLLQRCGYATCVVGKWQLYGSVNQAHEVRGTGSLPGQAGFDESCLWQIKDRGPRYKDPLIAQNGKAREDLEGKYGPDVFTDYALDFIERHKAGPFFLYFPMALVHSPFVPTPDNEDWKKRTHKNNTKYFADMVSYMDKIVGRIVRKLDQLGLRENTLVLFTGDNGTHKSIKSKMPNAVIQGAKGETTDAGTRVPLIANWPGVVPAVNRTGTRPAGRVCSDLVDFTDFVPTFAEMVGISPPEDMIIDGRSFLPQLRGKKGNPRDWIFCHYDPRWGKRERRCFVRDKRWKLYDNGQLFNVEADVLEQNPIKPGEGGKEAASARKRLKAALDSMK
jgi:arylsulfatase A